MLKADLIVIGAGPAGLFSAIWTAKKTQNKKIIILEKNNSAGKKLLISGSGRCNLTHQGEIANFFDHYGENADFLLSPLYNYDNQKLLSFFKNRGLSFKKERGGKIFPKSDKAEDILKVLLNEVKKTGVKIIYNSPVKEVEYDKKTQKFSLHCSKKSFLANSLLIAAGGKSFPHTGSTGDGFNFAKALGHKIIEPRPALAPVIIENHQFKKLTGISLRNKELSLFRNDKLIRKWRGDLMITHKGLSGPAIINNSRYIKKGDLLEVNLLDYSYQELKKDLLKKIKREGKLNLLNLLLKYPLAQRLIEKILELNKIDPQKNAAHLSRENRKKVVNSLLKKDFKVKKLASYNRAMVTQGGIDLKEINPGTMESLIVDNLFAAGEVLDIDGDTGGYNLQAAFSTAYLAAEEIAKKI